MGGRHGGLAGPLVLLTVLCLLVAPAAAAAPPNDSFAYAQVISGWSGSTTGSNVGATRQNGEPVPQSNLSGRTVWYSWTPSASGAATLDTSGSAFDTYLAVYTGRRVDRLSFVAGADGGGYSAGAAKVSFNAVAGTTYRVLVDGVGGASGSFTLTWNRTGPANDFFATATAISGSSGTRASTNLLSTAEPGEPSHSGWGPYNSVWFKWTAPFTGRALFDVTATQRFWIAAYTGGSSVSGLTKLAGDDGYAYEKPLVVFNVVQGSTYWVAVDANWDVEGPFDLGWRPAPVPPNDNLATAQVLTTLAGSVQTTTFAAGSEPGEPGHYGALPFNTVWFRWTPQETGAAVFTLSGSRYDAEIAVYRGSAYGSLTLLDAAEQNSGWSGSVWFEFTAGTTYSIAIDEVRFGSPATLNWRLEPPETDPFGNWEGGISASTSFSGTRSGSNVGATRQPDEPVHGGVGGGQSTWHGFSSLAGTVTLELTADFDAVVAVYRGSTLGGLTPLGSGSGASMSVPVDGVQQVWIAVDGRGPEIGSYELRWSFVPAPPPNDDFANAEVLSEPRGWVGGRTIGATRETGEPDHAGARGHSAWYRWTAPADGRAVFDNSDARSCPWYHCSPETSFDTAIGVYRGSSLATLRPVAASDDYYGRIARVSFPVLSGETFYVAVDTARGDDGRFTLKWTVAPHNDDYADPQLLSGERGTANGTTARATWESWEASGSGRLDYDDGRANVWFAWRAPASQRMRVVASAANGPPELVVGVGSAPELFLPVDAWVESGENTSEWIFDAVAGTSYRLEVGAAYGSFGLEWDRAAAGTGTPANDDFAAATAVAGESGSVSADLTRSTTELGEPRHAGDWTAGTVWYRWTAPRTGTFEFAVNGTAARLVVAGYAGLSLPQLSTVGSGTDLWRPFDAVMRLGVTAGETFSIAVGYTDEYTPGSVTLSWRPAVDAPANDLLAAAHAISGAAGVADGTTAGASLEWGEPYHAGGEGGASVWYRWVAPATGPAAFTATAAEQLLVGVYAVDAAGVLTEVARARDQVAPFASRALWRAAAGTTYVVAVDPVDGTGLPVSVAWRQPPTPPNDSFANAEELGTSLYQEVSGDTIGATAEAGEPAHAGVAARGSVWYRWSSTSYGPYPVKLTTRGSALDTTLAVYTGTGLSSLVPVASSLDGEVQFTTAPSTTYWIAIDGATATGDTFELAFTPPSSPPNDLLRNAAPISGETGSVTGTLWYATFTAGDPELLWDYQNVWYRWTAPRSGTFRFSVGTNSVFDWATMALYAGTRYGELVEIGSRGGSWLAASVVAGETYSLLVAGDAYSFTVGWRPATAPSNDALASARLLSGSSGSVTDANHEASAEPAEPYHAGTGAGASLWYRWTAPAAGTLALDTSGSSFDTVVAVYEGTGMFDLRELAANDDAVEERWSGVRLGVSAGRTYLIAVDTAGATPGGLPATGDLTLSWRLAQPPANDGFAAGEPITGSSGTVSGTTDGARTEPGEPPHGELAGGASVWYRWTAPASGSFRFEVTSGAALVGLYSGPSVSELRVVRRSDDLGSGAGAFTVAARAGETYAIAVDSAGWTTGGFGFAWTRIGPENDAFADATPIGGREGKAVPTTTGASKEAGEPDHAGEPGGASVWYRWRAPATEVVRFDSAGSDFDTLLAVYSGSTVGALTPLASNDDADAAGGTSQVSLEAVEGREYLIAVDGKAGAAGNGVLSWHPAVRPANDAFAKAMPIFGRAGSLRPTTILAEHDPGERDHGGAGTKHSVWFRWKAPAAGTALFKTSYSLFDTVLAVYPAGAAWGSPPLAVDVASQPPELSHRGSVLRFPVTAGAEYAIVVDGVAGGWGAFNLEWWLPPANDERSGAIAITGEEGRIDGTTVGALPEQNGTLVLPYDVFYRWTAPATGTYAFEIVDGTPHDVSVSATNLAGAIVTVPRHWHHRVGVVAGTTYTIRVGGDGWQGPGDFTLGWRRVPGAPPNDNHVRAQAVSGSVGTAGAAFVDASLEPGEPVIGSDLDRSVWFTWTAPASGRVFFAVRTTGTASLGIGVYTGSRLDGLTLIDDETTFSWTNPSTQVVFEAVSGTTYSIALRSTSVSADLAWQLDSTGPASGGNNDFFANAHVLSAKGDYISANNTGATKEPGEPNHAGNVGGHSLWYSWRAPASGPTLVETTGCNWDVDSLLAVYTGSSVGSLTLIGANDDVSTGCLASRVTFNAVSGVTYRIAVDGYNGAVGSFTLHWTGVSADTEAPGTTIGEAPPSPTGSRDATFTFFSSDYPPSGTFQCSLDGGGYSPCASPRTYTGLAPGTHVFNVRAVDAAGNVDPWPATWTWTIVDRPANDAFAAAATLTGRAGSLKLSTAGATTEPGEPPHAYTGYGASVWYRWVAPTTGPARFRLPAGDAVYPIVAAYTGSTVGSLTAVPRDPVPPTYTETRYLYDFWAVAGTEYRIAIDAPATTVLLGWEVAPPNETQGRASVLSGPSGSWSGDTLHATGSRVWFTWKAASSGRLTLDTAGTAFPAILEVGGVTDDGSGGTRPARLELDVYDGHSYWISLRGRDGATGAAALSWSFVAGDSQPAPPTVSLSSPAAGATVEKTVLLAASAAGAVAIDHVEFLVDGVVVGTDTSEPYGTWWDSTTVANGLRRIEARAVDTAGTSSLSAAREVTVENRIDATPPETTIDGGPPPTGTETSASFSFSASEPGSTFECSLDGAAWTACTSPREYRDLAAGGHTFRVRATDAAGNVDPSPAERTWQVETT